MRSLPFLVLLVFVGLGCGGSSHEEEGFPPPEVTFKDLGLDPKAPGFAEEVQSLRDQMINDGDFKGLEKLSVAMDQHEQDTKGRWLRDLGMARVFLGKTEEAKRALEKSLRKDDTSPDSHGYLALAYLLEQEDGQAEGQFKHARGYATEQKVPLPPIVNGFAMVVVDSDADTASEILQPYLAVEQWKKLYERLQSTE